MLKIGEFSRLSQLTVKALRFYEREGILTPSEVDPHTGYWLYTTSQLMEAAKVKSLRQLRLSVEEIRQILAGADARETLQRKAGELRAEQAGIAVRISIIDHLLKERDGLPGHREDHTCRNRLLLRGHAGQVLGRHAVGPSLGRRGPRTQPRAQVRRAAARTHEHRGRTQGTVPRAPIACSAMSGATSRTHGTVPCVPVVVGK